jgi:hypothetical protein
MRLYSLSAVFLLASTLILGMAHTAAAQSAEEGFSKEQLEQIVAPIALYPDSLLTQVLMASTYPLEVVEAQRWVSQNAELKADALDKALLEKTWDPSVKALCHLPDVLQRMSDNLDWTQDLGDAFLGQKSEVMDTVQRMRGLAYEAGNLKTTEQQVVTQQPNQTIVIESPKTEVIYVPSYSPTVVYGSAWAYPIYYYPPMYVPPPPGYGLMTFGFGMAVGAALWGDCNWGGWGNNDIDIDINRYNEFNRNTSRNSERYNIEGGQGGRGNWQHNPEHRKGVNYRNPQTAQQFGARSGTSRVSRDQARGWSGAQAGNRSGAGVADRSQVGDRGGAPTAGQLDRSRAQSSAGQRDLGAATRQQTQSRQTAGSQRASRDSAFSGSRSPNRDRAASSRGASSRGTASFGGRSGGGGRRR